MWQWDALQQTNNRYNPVSILTRHKYQCTRSKLVTFTILQIWAAFENSIARARQHFFTESNVSFAYSRTIAFFKEHGLQECLVVPHVTAHSSNLFVIPPAKVARWCYEVQCPADTTLFAPARRMYKCKVRNLREMVTLDPFDLKLENGIFKGLVEKAWLELEVVEPIYHGKPKAALLMANTKSRLSQQFSYSLDQRENINWALRRDFRSRGGSSRKSSTLLLPSEQGRWMSILDVCSHSHKRCLYICLCKVLVTCGVWNSRESIAVVFQSFF